MNWKKLSVYLGIIVAACTIAGTAWKIGIRIDARYAKAIEFASFSFEQMKRNYEQDIEYYQRRIWALEDRYPGGPATMPPRDRQNYRDYQLKLREKEEKLRELKRRYYTK